MENPIQTNPIQTTPLLLKELVAYIAGYCRPYEKNILMKLCKKFNEYLKDRELILLANPSTISSTDKTKGVFRYTALGDETKLSIWLQVIKSRNINYERNFLGMTLFHIASDNENNNIMQLLIKHGAQVNLDRPPTHALHEAVYKGDTTVVERLLASKTYLNFSNYLSGNTSLHIASYEGHTEIVQLLLDKGAAVDLKNTNGCTALRIASFWGYTKIAQLLINAKANVNLADIGEYTPLYVASAQGHLAVVELLLNAGAKMNQFNMKQKTPLQLAQENEYTEIIAILNAHISKRIREKHAHHLKTSPFYRK